MLYVNDEDGYICLNPNSRLNSQEVLVPSLLFGAYISIRTVL